MAEKNTNNVLIPYVCVPERRFNYLIQEVERLTRLVNGSAAGQHEANVDVPAAQPAQAVEEEEEVEEEKEAPPLMPSSSSSSSTKNKKIIGTSQLLEPVLPAADELRPKNKQQFQAVQLKHVMRSQIPGLTSKSYYPDLAKLVRSALSNSAKAKVSVHEAAFYKDLLRHGLSSWVCNQTKINEYFPGDFYFKNQSKSR